MATVTVRNLPEEIHRALRIQAARQGRSMEAEIREILAQSTRREGRMLIGTELRHYAEQIGGAELEIQRDATPLQSESLE
ncbi:MAG: Arc family DNA-binding protein [Steroidobacteraceae bacterium]